MKQQFSELELLYKNMAKAMSQAKSVVQASSNSNTSTTKNLLPSLSIRVRDTRLLIATCKGNFQTWADVCSCTSDKAHSLFLEFIRCVTNYTALVAAGVKRLRQLDKITRHDSAPADEVIFMWELLTEAGLFYAEWPSGWPVLEQQIKSILLLALDSLMAWQLAFIRRSSHLWPGMQLGSSFLKMQLRIVTSATAAMTEINCLDSLGGDKLRDALARFPPEFLSNVCLYLTEGLGPGVSRLCANAGLEPTREISVLQQLPYVEMFGGLMNVVGTSMLEFDEDGNVTMCSDEMSRRQLFPAVFQAAKCMLLISRASFSGTDTLSDINKGARSMSLGCALNIMQRTLDLNQSMPVFPRRPTADHPQGDVMQNSSSGDQSSHSKPWVGMTHTDLSNLRVFDALQEYVTEFSSLAVDVVQLTLRSAEFHETSFRSTYLPSLLSAQLCAVRYADAWVSMTVGDKPLASSSTRKQQLQGLILNGGSEEVEEARKLIVVVAPLLQAALSSGEKT